VAVQILKGLTQEEWRRERSVDVTSTEVSALFDMNPYLTSFELFHRKHQGLVVEIEETERMRWGTRLEATIAQGVAEDRGWTIAPLKSYARSRALKMGSSFDYEVLDPERGIGILEIKNVDSRVYRDNWEKDEAPGHIELQLQHQLEIYEGDYGWGAIAALVGGNEPVVLMRDYDKEVGAAIRRKIGLFWADVEAGRTPEPRFPQDAKAVIRMHSFADPLKVHDGTGDVRLEALVSDYVACGEAEKSAAAAKDSAKAQILEIIGEAEKANLAGYRISAGMVGPARVEYDRAGYRGFRVTKVREKA